jgi:hypothetical protein
MQIYIIQIKPNPSEFSIESINLVFIFYFELYGGSNRWLKQVWADGKLNI